MKNFIKITALILCMSSCGINNDKLKNEAEEVIVNINKYKNKNGSVPPNLKVIGYDEKEEGPIYYTPWKDSVNYIIYYSTGGVGESNKYYSDSKKWETIDRGIN
ncbi:hypothetical protein [Paenimyroides baculatum]|uniref:Uncharacterized protein n=1 Tax=Paenimyroides baculatum TaxID=2608000 RepID=A0A5M6CKN6_9FLAO|nr:hypothetical protein [Paenimyroides baculatum]KAA5535577.1 hypothetical protein F0460_07285 [Paenimyroides baculatum]